MKHLIETANPSGLATVRYDRIVLNSSTNDIIVKGGGYEYVDLGLSVKWAKCNIGAETETDYGDYFMWGSTEPNNDTPCDWEHAPFNNGSLEYDSGYFNSVKNIVAPNGVLAKEYDAAAQIMGGNWRMPTKTEFKELIDNTTKEWTTINGVSGRKLTSKKEGYQNNSIFFPASGYRAGSAFSNQGISGDSWNSSLDTSGPESAKHLTFDSGLVYANNTSYRYYGYAVRGVCE